MADAALTVTPGNITATQGELFSGNVATITYADPYATAADLTAVIDWGDGGVTYGTVTADGNISGQFDLAGSYAYGGNGSYNVSVTITDDLGNGTATGNATATVDGLGLQARQP